MLDIATVIGYCEQSYLSEGGGGVRLDHTQVEQNTSGYVTQSLNIKNNIG